MATTEKKKTKENTEKEEAHFSGRLHRSISNKIIAGVAGGLGEYFNIDPTIIRIIFVMATIFGGSGIFIYIVLWIVMPSETHVGEFGKEGIRGNVDEMKEHARTFAHNFRYNSTDNDSRFWWAILIIVLGFLFLSRNLGIFEGIEIGKFWPIILIVLGLGLISRKKD